MLSVLVNGDSERGATIAAVVLPAIRELDDAKARFCFDLIYRSLSDAARRDPEAATKYCESDFAEKFIAYGRAEARAEVVARALLTALRVRGLTVPDAVRERLLVQKDPERLMRWLEKACVAASVSEVIDEPN